MEERKTLKSWEALKALEEGHKIRLINWAEDRFIYMYKNEIVRENGRWFEGDIQSFNLKIWELYSPPKKKIKKEFWIWKVKEDSWYIPNFFLDAEGYGSSGACYINEFENMEKEKILTIPAHVEYVEEE